MKKIFVDPKIVSSRYLVWKKVLLYFHNLKQPKVEKPKYVIVYHQYTVDEQEKWLVEVKRKTWYGYGVIDDVGVDLISAFPSCTKSVLVEKAFNTQDEARKWALEVIQEDSQEVSFIKKIEEGIWL